MTRLSENITQIGDRAFKYEDEEQLFTFESSDLRQVLLSKKNSTIAIKLTGRASDLILKPRNIYDCATVLTLIASGVVVRFDYRSTHHEMVKRIRFSQRHGEDDDEEGVI